MSRNTGTGARTAWGRRAAVIATAALFVANATGSAEDADDYVVYDTDTGKLFYDRDGNGAGEAIQFAALSAGLGLTNQDFLIV